MEDAEIRFGIGKYIQPIPGGYTDSPDAYEQVGFLPGTTVRIWYTYLDTAFGRHWHDAMEIILGERGYYQVGTDAGEYLVRPEEALILPPGLAHSLTPKDSCSGFVYLIDLSVLNAIQSMRALLPGLNVPLFITRGANPKAHITISAILAQIRDDYFGDNPTREIRVYSHLLALIAEIAQLGEEARNPLHLRADKRKEYTDTFDAVMYYVNNHCAEDLTLEQTARAFGFSKFHFTRAFKQYTGFTFCDYLTCRRIEKAEQLLAHPDFSITEIAERSGFSCLSTFSRLFHKHKKCTPTEYRSMSVGV
jgi:AraC-like DNA-binding protein